MRSSDQDKKSGDGRWSKVGGHGDGGVGNDVVGLWAGVGFFVRELFYVHMGHTIHVVVVVIMGLYLIHPSTNQEKRAYSK